jgi:Protein of unknown function (DUF3995)
MTTTAPTRAAARLASVAAILMVASAAISAYWAVGGTGLLDTVGGSIARWGREGGVDVRLALTLIVVLKLVAAWLPLAAVRPCRSAIRRLAWLEAVILTVYGGVLTGAGLAVQAGIVDAGRDPDWKALGWHAYVWDPWFLVTGVLVLAALQVSRAGRPASRDRRAPAT